MKFRQEYRWTVVIHTNFSYRESMERDTYDLTPILSRSKWKFHCGTSTFENNKKNSAFDKLFEKSRVISEKQNEAKNFHFWGLLADLFCSIIFEIASEQQICSKVSQKTRRNNILNSPDTANTYTVIFTSNHDKNSWLRNFICDFEKRVRSLLCFSSLPFTHVGEWTLIYVCQSLTVSDFRRVRQNNTLKPFDKIKFNTHRGQCHLIFDQSASESNAICMPWWPQLWNQTPSITANTTADRMAKKEIVQSLCVINFYAAHISLTSCVCLCLFLSQNKYVC